MNSTERDVDVVVIGSGAAGLAAAVAAHERGARRILVAESEDAVGGSSRLAGGAIFGSESRLQRKLGIDDNVDWFYRDYLLLNQYAVDPGPVRTLTRRAGETVDWLEDHGVAFFDEMIFSGVEPNKRGHFVRGGGQAIIDALHRYCRHNSIDIALRHRVDQLITEDGAVVGVAVEGQQISASAVVVATGGFGADPDKMATFYPSACFEGWSWYIGANGARGDAIDFGGRVGAQLVGWDRGLRTLSPHFAPLRLKEPFQPSWSVILSPWGRRFLDESVPYGILDVRLRAVGNHAFIVFDDMALRPPAELAESYRKPYRQDLPGYDLRPQNYVPEIVDEMVEKGRMCKANTVEELAEQLSLKPETVTCELARYNRMAVDGEDVDFFKQPRFLKPIQTPPFYGAEIRPCVINWTGYGLRIDRDTRVLHESGVVIDNLFAAGECTGGVMGPVYVGSGNSLGNSCTMGRVAGEAAAVHVAAHDALNGAAR
jgi:flavocytochrome c